MIIMLTEKEKKFLLELARRSIKHYLEEGTTLDIKPSEIESEALLDEAACFVTIKKGKELRGCIGSLEPHRSLLMDVIHNAVACAFADPRFYPLSKDELKDITISISVLSKPEPFPVDSPQDLLKKLIPKKHGLILEQGLARATFLPVVWEQLPEKEEFLSHLSMKAGLEPDGWRDPKTKFLVYEAQEFSED
jgi:AmmeMemoRadiSam system protein A